MKFLQLANRDRISKVQKHPSIRQLREHLLRGGGWGTVQHCVGASDGIRWTSTPSPSNRTSRSRCTLVRLAGTLPCARDLRYGATWTKLFAATLFLLSNVCPSAANVCVHKSHSVPRPTAWSWMMTVGTPPTSGHAHARQLWPCARHTALPTTSTTRSTRRFTFRPPIHRALARMHLSFVVCMRMGHGPRSKPLGSRPSFHRALMIPSARSSVTMPLCYFERTTTGRLRRRRT